MRIGGAMFFTDYSMSPTELARALEDRGFDSLWVPEHSHIPLTRKSPFPSGGDLPKKYYDAMDPFVVLRTKIRVWGRRFSCPVGDQAGIYRRTSGDRCAIAPAWPRPG